MFYPYFDSTYYLVIVGVIISLVASARVRRTFERFNKVRNQAGLTGAQAAQKILRDAGLFEVRVEHVAGNLSDHYDPRRKVLSLSDSTFHSASVAAVGVAAHECGHAIQHAEHYAPLTLRGALVPAANFGSMLAWPLIVIGFFINSRSSTLLINIGIIAFSLAVLFQLVTLPVEYNASGRALRILSDTGMLSAEELKGTNAVLKAAALTYVAATAASILQLLRILMLTGRRNN